MPESDPHPTYAEWRRESAVRRLRMPGGFTTWLVTRYDEARSALADPRLSKSLHGYQMSPAEAAVNRHMLAVDPPDHTRLRRLVTAAFTARRIELLRPRIEEITAGLLDDLAAGPGAADLIDAFAFPLPIQVICDLLGIPAADRDRFREWSTILVGGSTEAGRVPGARDAMVAYIRNQIALRRVSPGDDLLSGLIGVRDEEQDRLTEDELTSMVFLLLIAGHETTVNLIGNGVFLLLSDRSRWARLRASPELLPTAIEEFLRYEGPVETATFRVATETFELGGQVIREGDPVLVSLLAANRDDRFDEAGELRLERTPNPHLAFGHGIHYCLGAPLARLEARIAFTGLLSRFPDLALAAPPDELSWRPGLLIRGLQELPVTTGQPSTR
jgi:cytochrome P450